MEQKSPGKKSAASEREARLKAALKANLGRRKAQARVRTASSTEQAGPETPEGQKE